MKGIHISSSQSQCIVFWKYSLTYFQIFKSKTLDICCEVQQLAEATVGMIMKWANKRCVLQFLGMGSYDTICQCSLELTTDIVLWPGIT